jgi:hypothetical protein
MDFTRASNAQLKHIINEGEATPTEKAEAKNELFKRGRKRSMKPAKRTKEGWIFK